LTKAFNFEALKHESPKKENKIDPEEAQSKMMGMVERAEKWNLKKNESK